MSLRRAGALGVVLLTAVLLQVSLLPIMVVGSFVPDLVVVVLVVLALESGTRVALWAAGITGALIDLLSVTVPVGSSVLIYATVVYGLGLLRPYLAERSDLTTAVLAGLAGAVAAAGHAGLQLLLADQPILPARVVGQAALVIGAFAVLLAPVVLGVVRRVLHASEASDGERIG
jgi:rod shape-determining protein MreD